MRTILYLSLVLFCPACMNYQIYEMHSSAFEQRWDDGYYTFEEEDWLVQYDFWLDGGEMYFKLYNKTEQPLYVLWDQSYYHRNGEQVTYYNSRGRQDDFYVEEMPNIPQMPIVKIMPKQAVTVGRFALNLEWIPLGKKIDYADFNKMESPLLFKNKVAYSKQENLQEINYIEQEFWVSEITELKKKKNFKTYVQQQNNTPDRFFLSNNRFPNAGEIIIGELIGLILYAAYQATFF